MDEIAERNEKHWANPARKGFLYTRPWLDLAPGLVRDFAAGLLGAHVTVLDLTEGQLEGDRMAAEHFGYEVRTVRGDMRDLSVFDEACFDIVYQAISIVFVPSAREVYEEVHRVRTPGGYYRAGH